MNVIRAVAILSFATIFGLHIVWGSALTGVGILFLIVLSYLPFGIVAAALVLGFRTTGPFPTMIFTGSALLGGVYYPTQVIPSWLAQLSVLVPLRYGLKSLRRTWLDGAPLSASFADLGVLVGMILVGFALSILAFTLALRYSKRAGTLAQDRSAGHMQPFYFGTSQKQLFGVYHPPGTKAARQSAICCAAARPRETAGHRAFRNLAVSLAAMVSMC